MVGATNQEGVKYYNLQNNFQLPSVATCTCTLTLYLCDSLVAGGTDIISCFAGQNPTVPVYRGEIQTRNLGMAMECWNQDGKKQHCGTIVLSMSVNFRVEF